MQLAQGLVVGERYRLERLLGEGGMGAVWSATHLITHKPVALKFIKEIHQTPQVKRRFLREARAASAVRHPNVVQVHDILELDDGSPVMVMDLLEGESLSERLGREGRLDLASCAKLLVPVISAVGTAHAAGVIHRDLKPENIFLVKNPPDVKVLDFGIAKFTSAELEGQTAGGLTQTGAMLGTPYYMSPEQAFGEADIDHRADIWAVGVILYECLSGTRPVDGENIGQVLKVLLAGNIESLGKRMPALPRAMTDLVDRMLSSKREARPSDLREVLAMLRSFADVAGTSFDAPRALVVSSDSSGRVSAFDQTADASQRALAETTSAHEVDKAAAQKRAPWPWLAAAVVVVGIGAGAIALSSRPAPSAPVAAPSTPVSVSVVTSAPTMGETLPSATEAHAEPSATATQHAISRPRATSAALTSAAPSASKTLPGGVYGQAPF